MNPLYQQLNPKISLPENVKQMITKFKSLSNPQSMVQNLIDSNPQAKALIQAANGNPEKAFRDLAQQMNVDADEIINMLK